MKFVPSLATFAGGELMEWFFHTRVWRKMHGFDDGETGVDNEMRRTGRERIAYSSAVRPARR